MNHATTANATKNETINPIASTIQSWGVIMSGAIPASWWCGITDFRKSYPVATAIVGIERKNENSSAAGRDMPAICPAAIVDIEREVPGKTADRIWQAPIQIA